MGNEDQKNKANPVNSKGDREAGPVRNDNVRDDGQRPKEVGGRGGLDPTRYGDWEKAGRCVDF